MRIDGKNDEDNEQIDRSGQKHDLLVVFVVVVQIILTRSKLLIAINLIWYSFLFPWKELECMPWVYLIDEKRNIRLILALKSIATIGIKLNTRLLIKALVIIKGPISIFSAEIFIWEIARFVYISELRIQTAAQLENWIRLLTFLKANRNVCFACLFVCMRVYNYYVNVFFASA